MVMTMFVLSLGANAAVLELTSGTLGGTININAILEGSAKVTWTANEMYSATSPFQIVDVDLGTINPLSATICTDITGGATVGLGDLSGISCAVAANNLHVAFDMAGLVQTGGSNTVDIAYVPTLGDFGLIEVCANPPTLGTSCGAGAALSAQGNGATFSHHVHLGLPLNSGSSYTLSSTNTYSGSIAVNITVN